MEGRPGPSSRRPPAHRSVSLRHPPSVRGTPAAHPDKQASTVSTGAYSDQAKPPLSVSPSLQANKQSSGESSDADAWFDSTNKKAEQTTANAQFDDYEPPFFLRNNSSSSETPPEGGHARAPSTSIAFRPPFRRLNTDGSTSEDFRGVIDDLTVANKKLKQKLKKYEKPYDVHLQNEKLFEVRFHGLPDHKKKELEETLRKFAISLDEPPTEADAFPSRLKAQPTISSTHATDSGYATMSGSGRNSMSTPAGHVSGSGLANDTYSQQASKSSYALQQQNVHSYLHDIPAGLLPRSNAKMSESTKKKLVVRRLEQVFAGKMPTPGVHQQPVQQEEVAQSAAMADRMEKEAAGRFVSKEGLREALIMPATSEEDENTTPPNPLMQTDATGRPGKERDTASNRSPDQRPTRPLDLDPARAQVPADNMEYMRHLGFTLPPTHEAPQDGHGWVYLNLLINMAQLHTINVTPDFVKEALNEYSTKFELSHDGRKVRWRGGQDMTLNSDSSSEQLSGTCSYDRESGSQSGSGAQTAQAAGSSESLESDQEARRARFLEEKERNKLAYTPIFFHRQDSEEDDDIYNGLSSSSNSPPFGPPQGDSSGFTSSGLRSDSSRRKRDDGPMIFYNKASFCTDLSGHREDPSAAGASTAYDSIDIEPLGVSTHHQPKASGLTELRGSFGTNDMQLDSQASESAAPSSEENFSLSLPELRSDSSGRSPSVEFEASGIGGVLPEDNFSIRVKRRQTRDQHSGATRQKARKSRFYSSKIMDVLDETPSESQPVIKDQIISTASRKLPSSALPPPSYMPFDSTSSGDVDSDLESDVSSSPSTSSSLLDAVQAAPTPQINPISPLHPGQFPTVDDEESSGEVSEGSDNSSIEVDAGPPGVVGSNSDGNMTDRFADIPAGSSAATAGGGSGFNSPIDFGSGGIDMGSHHNDKTRPSSHSPTGGRAGLKRERTSDSINASLREPSKSQRIG